MISITTYYPWNQQQPKKWWSKITQIAKALAKKITKNSNDNENLKRDGKIRSKGK